EHAWRLKLPADSLTHNLILRERGDLLAFEDHRARGRAHPPDDGVAQCGLSGAVGPDEDPHRGWLQVETHAIERFETVEANRQILYVKQWFRHFDFLALKPPSALQLAFRRPKHL